jgi:flagellar assembly protein FliH
MPPSTPTPETPPRLVRPTAGANDSDSPRPLYPVARLIKGAVVEAEQERTKARQLLEQALAEAQRITEEAKAQAEIELSDAREKGYREGFLLYHQLIDAAQQQVSGLTERFTTEVTSIAFRVAREVLDVEFTARPERIMQVVTAAVDHLRSRFPQRILVHLHPLDFDFVQSHKDAFAGLVPPDIQFSLVKDSDLQRYEVLLETEMGHYDFSVESQLEEIRKVLGEERRRD